MSDTPQDHDTQQVADFRIARDGTWYHDGAPIQREALAKLFSDRALKCDEEGRYWLQTPFEKYPVEVEDVPYVIVDYTDHEGEVGFVTNMEERIALTKESVWELRGDVPYIEVRDRLFARLSRSVFYNLVEAHGASLRAAGKEWPLGRAEEL